MFVITGGGSGIGRALALTLAKRGEKILIVGRRQNLLAEVAKISPNIQICQADVSISSERDSVVKQLQGMDLKGLVHNAAMIEPLTAIKTIQENEWVRAIATNVNPSLFLTQSLLKQLKKGKVLNIGSGAAYFPVSGWAAYCVSKAALSMLTRCWQLEMGFNETAFANVMPGIIDTPMQEVIRRHESELAMEPTKHEFFQKLFEEKRLITPETVAQFLCWLLLDINHKDYSSKEWDIYDKSHHSYWLKKPYHVPYWEET